MKEATTRRILKLLEQENKEEFLKIVYEYKEECIGYLLSKTKSGKDEAEDIFIDSVINLWDKAGRKGIDDVDNVKAYLFGTCFTMWKNRYNRDKRRREAIPDVELYFYDYLQDFHSTESPEQMKNRLLEVSAKALKSLGEKCKSIIRYFYFENKDQEEIAELMGFSSAEVVSTTKYRCFKELRKTALKLEKASD